MSDLERFAAALLTQWRAEGGTGGGPMGIDTLLDRIFPYRTARRLLGIDISEDYEALVLRLVAGEDGLATSVPEEAGEMARTTMSNKIPDLDTLRLLRSASITLTDEAVGRLHDVSFGGARAEADAKWGRSEIEEHRETAPADEAAPAAPTDVIPLPTAARDATRVATTDAPLEPPPAYLTGAVAFTPPAPACWNCNDDLPTDRVVKFCPFCGADQRPPACAHCGTSVERHWKHCPECGKVLGTS